MNTIDPAAYEGDIVQRLRIWRGLHLAHGGELFEEAAAEIASLREAIRRLAEQDATLSLLCKRDGSQVVTVTMDGTLTDAERRALEVVIESASTPDMHYLTPAAPSVKDILRGLLERTQEKNDE